MISLRNIFNKNFDIIALAQHWLSRHLQTILRFSIISGVLFLSFIATRVGADRLLLALLGFFGLFIFFRWPPLGLILTLIGGFAVRYHGPSGLNVAMIGIALLLALWVFELIIQHQPVRLASLHTTRPMLVLIGLCILSMVAGQLPWYLTERAPLGAQFGSLALFILLVGTYLIAANRIPDLTWLQVITWIFVIYASLYVIGRLAPPVFKLVSPLFMRGSNSGSLFWVWLVSITFSQAIFNRRLPPIARIILFSITVMTLYVGFVLENGWKSGWLPPLVAIVTMLMAYSWRFIVAFAILGTGPAIQLVRDAIGTDLYSFSTRLDAQLIVTEITKVNPLLGLGPANYFWYTPLFPIRGYAVQFSSHSQYIDLFAQIGILGTLCFLWCFWEIGVLGWRLRSSVLDGFAKAYVYGALGGLVGTVVAGVLGDWIVPFFYNIGMTGFRASMLGWLFLGGLVVIERVTQRQSSPSDDTPRDKMRQASNVATA